ncbi:uncharacterized protein LOC129744514 [Uranotaenia lowii]|uniref:uncharacterized protein LOC129744514 n=1 Tax=Uranotaenia lowii TaxID=190385 RepID=UPI00247A342F|nr:uncharacterized protein LOC129744514 [Uranotaenia lowii]
MVKFFIAGILALALIAITEAASFGQCPVASNVQTCTPKCLSDVECSTIGGQCCPNACNYKSCVSSAQLAQIENKYPSEGTGTYCGNVKCNAYEKCELDRATKRQKCTRS